MRERGGRTIAMPIANTDKETIQGAIIQNVAAGSMLNTDEALAYSDIAKKSFKHEAVSHSAGEFVRDDVTTNGIESVFAVMKRGLIGIYHHAARNILVATLTNLPSGSMKAMSKTIR